MQPKRKLGYVYYSVLGIALALIYFLQTSTGLFFPIWSVRPIPAFMLMLCISAFGGQTMGIISGLALGIVTDVVSTAPDGFNALTMMLMGLACSLLATYLFNSRLPAAMVLCGIFTALYYLLNWIVCVVARGYEGAFTYLWRFSLPGAIYTWLFVFIFWPLVSLFTRYSLKAPKQNQKLSD